ncbi:MAG: hypothetical protein AB7F23_04810 [Phycisphaerae bacterium]|jgi:hypothetical protein
MNFIKRYLSVIIPGVIFVVGIFVLVLTFIFNAALMKDMKARKSQAATINSLIARAPSAEQYKREAAYQKQHEEDARAVESLFLQSTLRELVSYRIFPAPKDTSRQIYDEFSRNYRAAIEEMVAAVSGVDAPSDSEISSKQSATRTKRTTGEEDPIVEALCRNKAASNPVYMNPQIFPWYDIWYKYSFVNETKAIEDCWNSQVALWVYQDIVDSVSAVNLNSKSVFASPVKRLIGVMFTQSADVSSKSVGGRRAANLILDMPYYITEDSKPILTDASFTGRVGDNSTIDVIQFSVSVVVAVDKIPDFVTALCSSKTHQFKGWDGESPEQNYVHNQITILDWNSQPIIPTSAEHKLYRYGEKAVVQWTATCEYLFARKAYTDVIPESIKESMLKQSKR